MKITEFCGITFQNLAAVEVIVEPANSKNLFRKLPEETESNKNGPLKTTIHSELGAI